MSPSTDALSFAAAEKGLVRYVAVGTTALPEVLDHLIGTRWPVWAMMLDRAFMVKEHARGNLAPEALPSERALCARWGVSRGTARRICQRYPLKAASPGSIVRSCWAWSTKTMGLVWRSWSKGLRETSLYRHAEKWVREAVGVPMLSHFRTPEPIADRLWEHLREIGAKLSPTALHEYLAYLVHRATHRSEIAPPPPTPSATDIASWFSVDVELVEAELKEWSYHYPVLLEGPPPVDLTHCVRATQPISPVSKMAAVEAERQAREARAIALSQVKIEVTDEPTEGETMDLDKLNRLGTIESRALEKTRASLEKRQVNVVPKTVRDWFIEARAEFFPEAGPLRPWISKDLAQAKQLLQLGTVAEIKAYVFWAHQHWKVLTTHLTDKPLYPRVSDLCHVLRFDAWKPHLDAGTVPELHFSAKVAIASKQGEFHNGRTAITPERIANLDAVMAQEVTQGSEAEAKQAALSDPRSVEQREWEFSKGGYPAAAAFAEKQHAQGRTMRHPLETGHYPIALRLLVASGNEYAQKVQAAYGSVPGWEKWFGDEGHDPMKAMKADFGVEAVVSAKKTVEVFSE